jgi:H+/Cl- antiporter ClcA
MSEAGSLRLEELLSDALRPIEPPDDLVSRVESTLTAITEQAAAQLSSWAEELSEGEREALRDPRNWVRPVAAAAVGTLAGGALVVVSMRRRRRPAGIRATAENVLRQVRPD